LIPENRLDLYSRLALINEAAMQEHKDADLESYMSMMLPKIVSAIPAGAFDPLQPFDQGILFYHGDVNESHILEIQHDITRVHLNLAPDKPILINMSSFGGGVHAGNALISTIRDVQRQGRKVNIHVQGTAMSMATIILQEADYRSIESGVHMMIHEVQYGSGGSHTANVTQQKFSERLQTEMFSRYTARTGMPPKYYMDKIRANNEVWYLSAEEALAEGLVDEVVRGRAFTVTPRYAVDVVRKTRKKAV
jgi:ATP-dependent protease ClpP protease subunit